jgi:DNA polymerase III alpha subunit (gram-positive type)
MDYILYVLDCESTGLNCNIHEPIEISIHRLSDDVQKTWFLQPLNIESIDPGALRVNGHKLEDLKLLTPFGRETYKDPKKQMIDIENWVMEDSVPSENRILVGQNVLFDKQLLESSWTRNGCKDSFPFGRRYMDTAQIEFFLNYCEGKMLEGYSLSNITKKYGVKNEKAHSAEADVKATKEVFFKQVEYFKKKLIKNG